MVLRDFSLGIEKSQLLEMYKTSVEEGFGHFLKIETTTNDRRKRFSKDWNHFFNVRGEFDSSDDEDDKDDKKK